MLPALWNRVNLDSSDHMTFFHCSRVQFLCSLANWSLFFQLASLISGFLKATQLFSPNPLSSLRIVRVKMLLLSLLNIPVSSTVVVFLRFDFTKRLNDRRSQSLFFDYISSSVQTVLIPTLVVSAVCLGVFFAWCTPLIWAFWNRWTSFPRPQDVSSNMVV